MPGTATDIQRLSVRLGEALGERGAVLATAESCTGGWIAQAVTSVAGSSGWSDRGFVTYSNAAKRQMLGVSEQTLSSHGAVSEAVVEEMALGALRHSDADVSVAVSGVAGPEGGGELKPVGTVCLGWALRGGAAESTTRHYPGDREAVRRRTVVDALQGLIERLSGGTPADV